MDAARWKRIKELFSEAERLPDDRRADFLERECGTDRALRREVETLLEVNDQTGPLDSPQALLLLAEETKEAPTAESCPERIGSYRVIRQVGLGGMGVVYEALDESLDRRVALKFLPRRLEKDARAKTRFIREARLAASMDHPFICRIYEVGEDNGRDFISMEFVDGETLHERLKRGRIGVEECLWVACEIAEALEQAHEKGIVHRDLKPSNVMLTSSGHLKVMDFGVAKRVKGEPSEEEITEAGVALGTLNYMSPEQLRGREVDTRADLFSFGSLLYEMYAGTHPFRQRDTLKTVDAILNQPPRALPPPGDRRESELGGLIGELLEKELEDRPGTVAEVRSRLEVIRRSGAGVFDLDGWRGKWNPLLMGGVFLVVLAGILLFWSLSPGTVEAPAERVPSSERSLAVLPFRSLNSGRESDYFSAGVTEDVISRLAQVPGLRVISRTSVLAYGTGNRAISEIGSELGVTHILDGSVRISEDEVRVAVQMFRTADEAQLWTRMYDGRPGELFSIQGQIAGDVADQLQLLLSSAELSRLRDVQTLDFEAYNLALRARKLRYDETVDSLLEAVDYYEQALNRDPRYVEARAGLSQTCFQLSLRDTERDWLLMARDQAAEALAVSSESWEAHLSAALVAWYELRWLEAEEHFRKAISLNPNAAASRREYGVLLSRMGRHEEAIVQLELAYRLDPLWKGTLGSLALGYLSRGEPERAEELAERLMQFHGSGQLILVQALVQKQEYERALSLVEEVLGREGRKALFLAEKGYILAVTNRRAEADRVLAELIGAWEDSPEGHRESIDGVLFSPARIALVYAGLGEEGRAWHWLNQMERGSTWVLRDPRFEPLCDPGDAYYLQHLERMKLPAELIRRNATGQLSGR